MLEKNAERKKTTQAVIRGLRVVMGLSKPDPSALSNSVVQSLLGKDTMKEIMDELQFSLTLSPQIVFIGKTGVGKSSTINELFDPDPHLPVDHVEPATIKMEIRDLMLGARGKLTYVDCPGLGAGEVIDKRNIKAYKEILSNCDVAVWIIKADDRTLGFDQALIKEILPDRLKKNLVIGINQVDKIEPGEWIDEVNLPSDEQVVSIKRKEEVVLQNFQNIEITPFAIVSYSAKRHYHLKQLFKAMVDACPQERVLALEQSKGNIRSFYAELQENTLSRFWKKVKGWFVSLRE